VLGGVRDQVPHVADRVQRLDPREPRRLRQRRRAGDGIRRRQWVRLDDPVLYVRDLGGERNKQLIRFLPDPRPTAGMQNGQLVLALLAR